MVHQAEARLHHNGLVGVVTQGRAELRSFSTPHIGTIKGKERCYLIQEEVRAAVGEERNEATGCLVKLGECDLEEDVGLSCGKPQWIKSLIQAVYDV